MLTPITKIGNSAKRASIGHIKNAFLRAKKMKKKKKNEISNRTKTKTMNHVIFHFSPQKPPTNALLVNEHLKPNIEI